MPLPKPSKMISKRFKKPQRLNPFIKPPPPPLPSSEQPLLHPPFRTSRLRVVCSDPDATDDSSADELDLPTPSRKLFIHEIFLPVTLPSLPLPHTSHCTRARRKHRSPNSNPIARSRKLCNDLREAEVILQDVDALFDTASEGNRGDTWTSPLQNRAMILPDTEHALGDEEFTQFLSEFVSDIGGNCTWEDGMDGTGTPQEGEIADMMNLELDSEALTWINSLQRLP